MTASLTIEQLTFEQAQLAIKDLAALLQDTVESGAAVGFIPPLSCEDAHTYWAKTISDLSGESRILLVARVNQEIAGAAQLELAMRSNGRHRAEVQKVMVHRRFRQQGIGRALMIAIEDAARNAGRTLLVLDTRRGDTGEVLYRKLGYLRAGVIPNYALSANGELHDTVIMYRQL